MGNSTLIDLTGKRFGAFTVLRRSESVAKEIRWECKCSCGAVVSVVGNNLRRGLSTKCRTCAGNQKIDVKPGTVFGKWTVVEETSPHIYKSGACRITYLCRCECGRTNRVTINNLRNGASSQCRWCSKQTPAHDAAHADRAIEPFAKLGARIGKWQIVAQVEREDHQTYWRCVCECGRRSVIADAELKRGRTNSCKRCARLEDLSGQTFARWTVVERVLTEGSTEEGTKWLCRCDCGNTGDVLAQNLKSGGSKQCGLCAGNEFIDLTGRQFGRWTVIESAGTLKEEDRYATVWHCQCECGEEAVVRGGNLRRGISKQCNACARGYMDLSGRKFGLWSVIERVADSSQPYPLWKCRCSCGREGTHTSHVLTSGSTTRCLECGRRERPQLRLRIHEALYKYAAKKAATEGHEWSLSYEEFARIATSTKCHYCWMAIYFAPHCINKNGSRYNLDRKDNKAGYVRGNVVPCCKDCNFGKGARKTYEEWWAMTACFRVETRRKTATATSSQCSMF